MHGLATDAPLTPWPPSNAMASPAEERRVQSHSKDHLLSRPLSRTRWLGLKLRRKTMKPSRRCDACSGPQERTCVKFYNMECKGTTAHT